MLISGMLNWYSGVDNFHKVKNLVQLLRKSCILTLATKHKKSMSWIYTVYEKEVIVSTGKEQIRLKSRASILTHRNEFNLKIDFSRLNENNVGNLICYFME